MLAMLAILCNFQVQDIRSYIGDATIVIAAIAALPEVSAGVVRANFVDQEAAEEQT